MDFWMRLKNEIKTKNTTQEWIAGKIGVPLSTFRKWMTKKTYPDIKEGVNMARLLETSAEYLVTGIEIERLCESEQLLISEYRKLCPLDKENTMLAVKAWARKK
jgi:transcriptional regulator with XRE-family HTH domain